ncbi:MAG: 3-oxoacyl-[acyl-carrier-protein] synthase 3 [Gammaproteobacteria bacterium]|nr:MAG: 3-oxoacyl-[acyl-carrier-protein] synthase 3 [Gammaproteobacteria bacterium]
MSRIIGTGIYLPDNVVTTPPPAVDGRAPPIVQFMTGLKERRHAADHETALYMGARAARRALEAADVDPADIDLVVGLMQPNQYLYPDDLFLVAHEAGCRNSVCIPVNTACSAFLSALRLADLMLRSGERQRALVVTAANWVRYGRPRIEENWFAGDGAGAVVLECGGEGLLALEETCDYRVFHTMRMRSPLVTGRPEYFEIRQDAAIDMVAEQVAAPIDVARRLLAAHPQWRPRWFIAHQAGVSMLELWRRRLRLPREALLHTFPRYANMSIANIPVTLHEYVANGTIARGDILLLFAPATGAHYIAMLWRY